MVAAMTVWEWEVVAVVTGLFGGVGITLISWLKEHLDRRARKISYHAKRLLEEANRLCGAARAVQAVAG